jgi:phosphotransferase system  glucose/maltose/N-acetylglucosamine-specific IIC component
VLATLAWGLRASSRAHLGENKHNNNATFFWSFIFAEGILHFFVSWIPIYKSRSFLAILLCNILAFVIVAFLLIYFFIKFRFAAAGVAVDLIVGRNYPTSAYDYR